MAETHRSPAKAFRWRRSRGRSVEVVESDPAAIVARQVRGHLALTNVHCLLHGAVDSVAATATLQLMIANNSGHAIEYRVESVRIESHNRVIESVDPKPDTIVGPGEITLVRGPALRAVDRAGVTSGNIDYVMVYGHPSAPPALRYRRQHGIWFRFEPSDDGRAHVRFVERYDEDDPFR